jgi:hypothetical protein
MMHNAMPSAMPDDSAVAVLNPVLALTVVLVSVGAIGCACNTCYGQSVLVSNQSVRAYRGGTYGYVSPGVFGLLAVGCCFMPMRLCFGIDRRGDRGSKHEHAQ